MATVIGLDIGTSAVRAVQLTSGRGAVSLDRLGQVVLPVGTVRDGDIADGPALGQALRTLWSTYGFKMRKVALGVANQQVVVRQVDLPYLPEDELRSSLAFSAQDYIPIPLEQAVLDFHLVENFETESGTRTSRVLLVAAGKQMVDGIIGVIRTAKLEPVSLDLDAFALLRSLAPSGAIDSAEGELLIDMGASVTNMVVHQGGTPRFVRILLMGGNGITEALVDALGMTWEQAEAEKAATGISDFGEDEAARIVSERASRFIEEIRGSLDYYAAQADAVPVRRVVTVGGASQLVGMRERLSQSLRLPVDRGSPMQDLNVSNTGLSADQLAASEPFIAVAAGLALGALR